MVITINMVNTYIWGYNPLKKIKNTVFSRDYGGGAPPPSSSSSICLH